MDKTEILRIIEKQPICTERTALNPMTELDFSEFLEHASHLFATDGRKLEDEFVKKCKTMFFSESEIAFAIRLKGSNQYIGYFEFKGIDTEPEIGIELIESFQKQGFGFEVCRAVVDYIFMKTDFSVLKCNCYRNNTASLRLVEKLKAIKIKEKILFEALLADDVPQSVKDEAAGFDLIIHEIKKQTADN